MIVPLPCCWALRAGPLSPHPSSRFDKKKIPNINKRKCRFRLRVSFLLREEKRTFSRLVVAQWRRYLSDSTELDRIEWIVTCKTISTPDVSIIGASYSTESDGWELKILDPVVCVPFFFLFCFSLLLLDRRHLNFPPQRHYTLPDAVKRLQI